MKLFAPLIALSITLVMCTTAFAGASYYENAQMHCIILKDGAIKKQTDCQADGTEYGGAGYGGGIDWTFDEKWCQYFNLHWRNNNWTFDEIKGFGVFVVSRGLMFAQDQGGDILMDENGYAKLSREWLTLNDKPALMFHRFPNNHQRFTDSQEQLYHANKLLDVKGNAIAPYHCLAYTQNPDIEFCFNGKF